MVTYNNNCVALIRRMARTALPPFSGSPCHSFEALYMIQDFSWFHRWGRKRLLVVRLLYFGLPVMPWAPVPLFYLREDWILLKYVPTARLCEFCYRRFLLHLTAELSSSLLGVAPAGIRTGHLQIQNWIWFSAPMRNRLSYRAPTGKNMTYLLHKVKSYFLVNNVC